MEGIPATYLGRIVPKEHFRAFIYGPNQQKRLVNSWDEFEAHMASGLWFATEDEAKPAPIDKPKRVKKEAPVVEVKEPLKDDFLPKD